MAWTYTESPTTNSRDEVHFLCGDTDISRPLLQDEEIDLLLQVFPKPDGQPAYLAAAQGCEAIAAKFGRQVDNSLGAIQRSASQMYEHYIQLAQFYRVAYATGGKGVVEGAPSSPLVVGVIGSDGTPTTLGGPLLGGGGPTVLGNTDLTAGGGG